MKRQTPSRVKTEEKKKKKKRSEKAVRSGAYENDSTNSIYDWFSSRSWYWILIYGIIYETGTDKSYMCRFFCMIIWPRVQCICAETLHIIKDRVSVCCLTLSFHFGKKKKKKSRPIISKSLFLFLLDQFYYYLNYCNNTMIILYLK